MQDLQRQLDENRREHTEFMNDVKDIKNDLNDIKVLIAQLPERFDERYATKKIENWFYAGVALVLLSIIGGLLKVVFKIELL